MNACNTVWGWGKSWDDSRRGNLISFNTLLSRTACTILPHQNKNVAPLAVAIETSPKEVSFGCKMRIYCFIDMQIFRLEFIFFNHSVFSTCVSGDKIIWFVTSYHHNIYNVSKIFLSGMRKYASVTVHHMLWPPPTPPPYSYVCPQGHPE